MPRTLHRSRFILLTLLALFSLLLSACSSEAAGDSHSLAMAPLHEMPAEVQHAPVAVQEAYQFNVSNPDVMTQLPCYCGCGAMGHTSNYACYVSDVAADGKVTFDTHALGCSICVDITQDTMRLLQQGKTVPEIKAFVDQTYAQYGPSNIP